MADPNFYRYYECNIECPKLKASKHLRCDQCTATSIASTSISSETYDFGSGIKTYTGFSPFGTVHTITSAELPPLSGLECAGEITFFLSNNDTYINVAMASIVKAKGTILQTLLYQKVGNFTSAVLTNSGNNIVLTIAPGGTCKWIYRGI